MNSFLRRAGEDQRVLRHFLVAEHLSFANPVSHGGSGRTQILTLERGDVEAQNQRVQPMQWHLGKL